jgi:hypothetical protein
MKLLLCSLAWLALALPAGAASGPNIAGNWLGTLEVQQVKLRILFKIQPAPAGQWTATMDSLDQGARDLPVDSVKLTNNTVRLVSEMLKGTFVGTLDKSEQKISGRWTQGTSTVPLLLEKTKGPVAAPELEDLTGADLAANKLAAEKIAGTWTGSIASPYGSLRLIVYIKKAASGRASGTMDSTEQGLKDIPLNAVTLKEGKVRFEARGLAANYEGTLSADGGVISGDWTQGGQKIALEFRKAPEPKPGK